MLPIGNNSPSSFLSINFHLNVNFSSLNYSCKFRGHTEEHLKMGSQQFALSMAKIIPIWSWKQLKVLLYLFCDRGIFIYLEMDRHRIIEKFGLEESLPETLTCQLWSYAALSVPALQGLASTSQVMFLYPSLLCLQPTYSSCTPPSSHWSDPCSRFHCPWPMSNSFLSKHHIFPSCTLWSPLFLKSAHVLLHRDNNEWSLIAKRAQHSLFLQKDPVLAGVTQGFIIWFTSDMLGSLTHHHTCLTTLKQYVVLPRMFSIVL